MKINKIIFPKRKIFLIGFNKTGTSTLCNYFYRNNIPSIHWDEGKIARKMEDNFNKGLKILNGYENFIFFSDMEDYINLNYAHMTYFKELDKDYPESKFIFNIRNVDNWIRSRNKHMNGEYTNYICNKLNMTKEELNNKWKKDFYEHKKNVIDYFTDKPGKLLIFDIEKDSPEKINDFFPELKLNKEFYKHINKTITN